MTDPSDTSGQSFLPVACLAAGLWMKSAICVIVGIIQVDTVLYHDDSFVDNFIFQNAETNALPFLLQC